MVFGAFRASAPPICARAARWRCALRRFSRDRHGPAAAREWRESGASSHDAARAAYISILRRRWGCTVALAGARLWLSRAYLAGGVTGDVALLEVRESASRWRWRR
jgi:hypothetical protein